MTLSVRLDEETRKLLTRLARSHRISQSEMVRRAIRSIAEQDPATEEMNVYERIKHLVGSVRGLPPFLSERTGDKFHEIVVEKHRRRQKR
jgi:replication initiation and membrane attachment protein DnaB